MRVCLAQYDIVWESKKENMSVCERFFSKAAEKSADLIVFPELSLTGFTMNTALAENKDGSTVRFFTECAERYGVSCVFGYAEKTDKGIFNRLAYADTFGRILSRYSKIHPFSYGGEDRFYSAGDTVSSFICKDMEIGMSICYDLRFPELYQRLSEKCGCIVVSANWPESRREHWLTLLKARAIENQCYILGCNRIGNGGEVSYSGDSVVFVPDGSEIVRSGSDEELIFADISSEEVSSIRNSFPLKNDRRLDIYKLFY